VGKHTDIQSLLNARLATISPALPICHENIDFTPPNPTDAVLPQISKCYFVARTPAVDDVYTITIDGVAHTASGASLSAIMAALTGSIVGARLTASPPTVIITGASDGTPFTVAVSAVTAGGVPIAGALASPAYATTQDAFIGNAWLRSFLMEGRPMPATIGVDGLNKQVGVFQVDVLFAAGEGWGDCKAMADTVCALFKRGTSMTQGTSRVLVEGSGPGPATTDGQWYRIPVSVYYMAFVEND
jgi:hypothetical protein